MSRLRGLRWPLLGAAFSALITAGVAGAGHGPADAVNAIHIGVSQTAGALGNSTELRCTSDGNESPCFDGLQDGTTNTAAGIRGGHIATTGTGPGIRGFTNSTTAFAFGVHGDVNASNAGGFSAGVRGENDATSGAGIGVWGSHAGSGWGGYFTAGADGIGVNVSVGNGGLGVSANSGSGATLGYGVRGSTSSTAANAAGVFGRITSNAANAAGVRGENLSSNCCGMGVAGFHAGQGIGIYGEAPSGFAVSGFSPNNWSGYFQGSVNVVGTLFKSSGAFRIDNPLDPAHSYLQHSFVESPDMKNIYDGVVRTNGTGFATVKLPAYFQALNKDFRYQLTVLGRSFAQAIVWKKIADNTFTVKTNEPKVEVSWQVTGIRHDRYANAHRIHVVVPKEGSADGRYVHPKLYGKPLSKSVVVLPGMTPNTQPSFQAAPPTKQR